MIISFEDFLKKYSLDDFSSIKLELKEYDKTDIVADLQKLLKIICRIFDKLTNIGTLRGGQVLMSLAKLQEEGNVINKTDIMHSLKIDRLEKLKSAFDYLERANLINIEEKTKTFHIVTLNEKDNPDLKILKEIVQKYWNTPEQEAEKAKGWRDSK